MSKLAARMFLCSGPAILWGIAFGLAFRSPELAAIVFVAAFCFGLHVTTDKPEVRDDE